MAAPSSSGPRSGRALVNRLQIAPMIDVTDRHFRMLIRCASPRVQLWSEMTWDRAILYNAPNEPEYALNKGRARSLESIIGFSPEEHPIVMQLGGSDPQMLARAAKLCESRGYDEINLNCGCPAQTRGRSRNCYGARLMFEPDLVARCVAAIIDAVNIPVTVKIRLGVDERDTYPQLVDFVRTVAGAGVRHFVVHARKAILGLDTIKNRSVPPLRYISKRVASATFCPKTRRLLHILSQNASPPPPFVSRRVASSTFCLKTRRLLHILSQNMAASPLPPGMNGSLRSWRSFLRLPLRSMVASLAWSRRASSSRGGWMG